jgi:hypothetical protein
LLPIPKKNVPPNSVQKMAGFGRQKSKAQISNGALPTPPRKAKFQNRTHYPKKLAGWNRLLSVWKRMEAFGSDWKRFQTDSGGLVRLFFFLNLNHKKKSAMRIFLGCACK